MFNEESLEKAVIELFDAVQMPHRKGETIYKEMSDLLLRDDLKQFLLEMVLDRCRSCISKKAEQTGI